MQPWVILSDLKHGIAWQVFSQIKPADPVVGRDPKQKSEPTRLIIHFKKERKTEQKVPNCETCSKPTFPYLSEHLPGLMSVLHCREVDGSEQGLQYVGRSLSGRARKNLRRLAQW